MNDDIIVMMGIIWYILNCLEYKNELLNKEEYYTEITFNIFWTNN